MDEREVVKEIGEAAHIADGVKCYLRDIGKIPLLNKKTESVIADQIALGKKESIEAISKFPFIHKEIIAIGERLAKNTIALKDIIQFSEFDEENLPKLKKKKMASLKRSLILNQLVENESRFIRAIEINSILKQKKKEMLDAVKANKEEISKTIQTIKLSNKFIRKLAKSIEKTIQKIRERTETIRQSEMLYKQYAQKKSLTELETARNARV